MGIAYDDLGEGGLVKLTVTGLASRTDHAVNIAHVRSAIQSGRLRALIIDASAAELPANPSFSREVWDDILSELADRPFAYLPPVGHDEPERQRMIADLVAEWGSCLATFTDIATARAWCADQLKARAGD